MQQAERRRCRRAASVLLLLCCLLFATGRAVAAAAEEQLMLTEQANCEVAGNGVLPAGISPAAEARDGTEARGTCSLVLPQLARGESRLYIFRIARDAEMSFTALMRARGGAVAMELYEPDGSGAAPDTSKPPAATAVEVRSGGVALEAYVHLAAAQLAARPGVYALRLRGQAGSPTVEVSVMTPSPATVLAERDRAALVAVAEDCCTQENWDSTFCADIAAKVLSPSRPWAVDLCHLPPNLCDARGRLTALSLRGSGMACPSFPRGIANLTALTRLDLGGNNIPTTAAAAAAVLSKLTLLRELRLANTRMAGPLDCALVAPGRRVIDVASNLLTGPIPECLLSSPVEELHVNRNELTGALPASDYSSSILTALVAGSQRRPKGGLTGPIPPALLSLPTLLSLNLAGNDHSGELPGLPPNAVLVNVSSNGLSGQLPALPQNMWALDATANSFSGPLPPLASLPHLETLLVAGNQLEGALPTLPQGLVNLDASYNRLKGPLPALPPSLAVLDVNSNAAPGLDGDIGALELGALRELRLGNNSFSGKIPPSLAKSSTLVMLSLRMNKISGPLPREWDTPSLEALLLSDNQITGTVPASLARQPELGMLRLEGNRLGGRLDAFAKALNPKNTVFHFDVSRNQLGGAVPSQLQQLGVFAHDQAFVASSGAGPLAFHRVFNVSENKFSGAWPAWLLSSVPQAHLACNCPVLARVSGPDMRLGCPWVPAKLGDFQWQQASQAGFTCWDGRRAVPLTDSLDSPNNAAVPSDTEGTAFGDSGPRPLTPGGSAGLAVGLVGGAAVLGALGYFVGYRRLWLERRATRFERFDLGAAAAAAVAAEKAAAGTRDGGVALTAVGGGGATLPR